MKANMNLSSDFFELISKGDQNLYVTLVNLPDCNSYFLLLDSIWKEHCNHISKLPEISTKDAYFLSATLFTIAGRQIRNAYFLLLRRLSYDALLTFRVALESTVFGFRIAKDQSLAEVWARKNELQKEFREKFRFAPFPTDMPFRDEIKKEIDLLNEYWSHPNVNYASRSLEISNREIRIPSYDNDDQMYYLALFSFLENSYRCLAIIRSSMDKRFSVYLTSTESSFSNLRNQLDALKSRYDSKLK
jgi:hypothetical protein